MVRAVDYILNTEFDLSQGLADSSKTKIKVEVQGKQVEQEVHKVQILDPAAGTGTFLAEVIKYIHQKFAGQQGIWSNYVETHLLPRLNGFELLMASYAMAHLQLDLLLTETGYKPKLTTNQRLRVYLTNSLEESHPDTGTLFANWLSSEANEANHIKRDTPVMCVIGNPPYSVSSTNKSEWIQNLISDYKKNLKEQKLNLDDDYIKFIRYGQYFIDKNGSGILAYISANSFIDGVTHRQMRKSLLESFDKIYILDLHGNAKKKEVCLDGSSDQNVFDIMQGVSINIFVKTGKKNKNQLGQVFAANVQGKRELKYDFLTKNNFKSIAWKNVLYEDPYYFFKSLNYDVLEHYNKGFSLAELFIKYNSGIQTKNDSLTIKYTSDEVIKVIEAFKNLSILELENSLIIKDSAGWKIDRAKDDILKNKGAVIDIQYRLFDTRKTYFTGKSSGFIGRTRGEVMESMKEANLALIFKRTGKVYGTTYDFLFVSKSVISEGLFAIDPLGREYLAPLYLYPETNTQQTIGQTAGRTPNLNTGIVQHIAEKVGLTFTNEKEINKGTFSPIDILDYIYAILYRPSYREKYKEFLKIDFPRVPYPKDQVTFWQLVKLGGEIRQIHLLESPAVEKYITHYPIDGDNKVIKPKYESGKVCINDTQYFDNVPQIAWEFYIGGYQPAQKWLKDRKDRKLDFDDILHYQKIIVALSETDRLMKEIDAIEF